jgi:hypothetical protein
MSDTDQKFNNICVWDNETDLFDKHFYEKFVKDKHRIVHLSSQETEFEKAILDYKKKLK